MVPIVSLFVLFVEMSAILLAMSLVILLTKMLVILLAIALLYIVRESVNYIVSYLVEKEIPGGSIQ